MIDWLGKAGKLRSILFTVAVIGDLILYIVYQPPFLPEKILILPFPFLIFLTLSRVIFTAIIIVECIRIAVHRSTSTWSLKKHFIVVLAVIIALAGLRVITFHRLSTRYCNYAWSLVEKLDYSHAIACLDIALKYDSNNWIAYTDRGYVHRKLGNLKAALSDYNTAIGMNPKNAIAYTGRGYVYYNLNDYQKALHDWDQAIAIDPKMSSRLEKWIKAAKGHK